MAQEIELKFIVEKDSADALRQHLNTLSGEHHEPVQLLNIYYETPDNWLRNHDELDLEGIGERNKRQVIRTFAPDKSMSVYQRGVRRRLAPMLDGDTRRIALAHAILLALPGVGRKTANVVLNTAFGWPTIAVDTHIFRVSNRTRFAPGKNVEEVEEKLLKVVPAEFKVDCHHWLILHGRYTCIARKPRCGSCIIEDLCEYKEKVYP